MAGVSELGLAVKQNTASVLNYQKVNGLINAIKDSFSQSQKTELQNNLVSHLNDSGVTPFNSLLNTDNLKQSGIIYSNNKFEILRPSQHCETEKNSLEVNLPSNQAQAFQDYHLRSAIMQFIPEQEISQDKQFEQMAQQLGKDAAEAVELGIAFIPVYGVSVDIKDILEQITNMFTGKEVDSFTLYLSVIGIATEFTPLIDPIVDLVKAVGKKITPEMQKLILDTAHKAFKLGKLDQLKAIGGTLEKMLKNVNTKMFDSELMRVKDLCEAMFFKFPKNLAGNAKLIADNLDSKVFPKLEDFYFALRKHVDDLSDIEVTEIKRIREELFSIKPGEKMIMIKVTPKDSLKYDTVQGFVVRAKDLEGIKNSDDLIQKLGLEYPGSKFKGATEQNIFIREFETVSEKVVIPYHPKKFGGPVRDYPYPGTGTGFTVGMIPEYRLKGDAEVLSQKVFSEYFKLQ